MYPAAINWASVHPAAKYASYAVAPAAGSI
jgi:hypothetical protein